MSELTKFYEKFDPGKVATVGRILTAYRTQVRLHRSNGDNSADCHTLTCMLNTKPQDLVDALTAKYGDAPKPVRCLLRSHVGASGRVIFVNCSIFFKHALGVVIILPGAQNRCAQEF